MAPSLPTRRGHGSATRSFFGRVAPLLIALFALIASRASAHIGHTIARAERYLKLDATEADTRFVVSLTLGAEEGRAVLEDVDTDDDGTVSERESSAYLATWAEGLATELPIEVDGAPLAVEWTDGWLDPLGPVAAVPVTVEMVAHLPLEGREHTVSIRDRMVRREVFDRTDVSFRAHDGAEFLAAGTSEAPGGIVEDEGFLRGGPTLEVLTARVRYPARSAVGPGAIGVSVGALVGVGLIVLLLRRRRA